ncbi:hypothetical protein [Thermocatellispora tengchongensis]|uniref:hypothetical protein n=1 Tax=Thermocatellispora tengchongensis TaxID=1073253 RepID=UPI0036437DB4
MQRVQQPALGQQGGAVLAEHDGAGLERAVREPGGVDREQRLRGLHQDRGGAARVGAGPGGARVEQVGHRWARRVVDQQPHLAGRAHQVGDGQQPGRPALGQVPVGGHRRGEPLPGRGVGDQAVVEQQRRDRPPVGGGAVGPHAQLAEPGPAVEPEARDDPVPPFICPPTAVSGAVPPHGAQWPV